MSAANTLVGPQFKYSLPRMKNDVEAALPIQVD